jgi:hypothetical protein
LASHAAGQAAGHANQGLHLGQLKGWW